MSNPIEKYKAELQAMLKFDEDSASNEARDRFDDNGDWYQFVVGAEWEHTKTAKIAQALLDAVEALEKYADPNSYPGLSICKPEDRPIVVGNLARETLEKLSKGG